MIDERHEERASLYVLGLLDPQETRAFEAELKTHPDLAKLVRELEDAGGALALACPTTLPPAQLKEKILQSVRQKNPSPQTALFGWIPWALAACLAIFCGLLVAERSKFHQEIAKLRARDSLAQIKIKTLVSQIENAPKALAVVIWCGDQQNGILRVEQLPPITPEQDYQLWAIDPRYNAPVSAGIFTVDQDGAAHIRFHPSLPIEKIDKFAVSLEKKGGVPKAEGPIVLLSN